MSVNLAFHIGYGKTGTTYLQDVIFSGSPTYLGKSSQGQCHFGRDTRPTHFFKSGVYHEWFPEAKNKKNVDKFFRMLPKNTGRSNSVFISAEFLSAWPCGAFGENNKCVGPYAKNGYRVGLPPFAKFIEKYILGDDRVGNLKIIISFRRQPEYLASFYAQYSNKMSNASQRDFEDQVSSALERKDPILNYASVFEAYSKMLGEENVKVVFFEDMWNSGTLEDLTAFLELRKKKPTGASLATNKRSLSRNVWELRKPDYEGRLTEVAPHRLGGNLALIGLERALSNVKKVNIFDSEKNHDCGTNKIHLHSDLINQIMSHVSESNSHLGDELGRDLSVLGYC